MIILSQMNNYGEMNFNKNSSKHNVKRPFSKVNGNFMKTFDEIKYGKTKRFMIK